MSNIIPSFKDKVSSLVTNPDVKNHVKACAVRMITAIALATLFGAFSIHFSLIGATPLATIISSACIISLKIMAVVGIQYAVEKIASKILNRIFIDDNAISKVVKFVAPLLLSISFSFGFLHAVNGLYGVETHYYDHDCNEWISAWEFENKLEPFFFVPTFSDGLLFLETWGIKISTEIALPLIERTIEVVCFAFQKASLSFSALKNRLSQAA